MEKDGTTYSIGCDSGKDQTTVAMSGKHTPIRMD
jgi:hypothetical protein